MEMKLIESKICNLRHLNVTTYPFYRRIIVVYESFSYDIVIHKMAVVFA